MAKDEEGSSVQKRVLLRHNKNLKIQLAESKEEYERQLAELREKLENQVGAFESETLQALRAELEAAKKRADIANNKLEIYAPKLKTLTSEKREQQLELKSQAERIQELEAEAEQGEARIQQATEELQTELNQARERVVELEEQLKAEKTAHEGVKSDLIRIFSELNQLKARSAKDQQALEKSEAQKRDLEAQLDGMASRFVTLGERVDFESNKNQLLNNEIARLKAQLNQS